MRLVLMSDTHGSHSKVTIPECDILIHCGDFSTQGFPEDIAAFANWFAEQPGIKICVAGNHDRLCEKNPDTARFIFASRGITYLQDYAVDIYGARFYGSPWQPEFCDWSFNLPRGSVELKQKWDAIPSDTDVLITHGPPHGILDPVQGSPTGCFDLRERVDVIRPKLHAFGHLHSGYGTLEQNGTKFYNCALLNEAYAPGRTPWVVDL